MRDNAMLHKKAKNYFSCVSALALPIAIAFAVAPLGAGAAPSVGEFHLEEATISDVHKAMLARRLTATELVTLYFNRIKAYNGACVNQPTGILGTATTIPHAGQLNALSTLNLRPAARKKFGFDDRKARSMTDVKDDDAAMPDAFEVAAQLDREFLKSGKLVGALHGIPIAIKDQYDTVDMRTTSGADAPYANDRPPDDSTFVKKLRAAGAIIIAKANMGEYAGGDRSSFGGVFCNPYDTERSPGRSSGGSASSVAANLVMCAIGEESGPSIRNPAKNNNVVGLAPTQELVSRDGMMRASFMNDRVGPICRTVEDSARILDVIAGYDPKDELTAFARTYRPATTYLSAAASIKKDPKPLKGMRIGVLREYMNKELFTKADEESIDLVVHALDDLRKLGATVVDPGAGGELFQACVKKYAPSSHSVLFTKQFPDLFPVDEQGRPKSDHIPSLVTLAFKSDAFPAGPSIRNLGNDRTVGEGRYVLDFYLKERGDANIRSTEDLLTKSTFYVDVREDSGYSDKRRGLENKYNDKTLDLSNRLATRFALQQIALQCMAMQNLDAVTYPTGNIPPPILGAPTEPTVNGRSAMAWTLLGANGLPAISVPAGFTTTVYDRVRDKSAAGGTRLSDPVNAALPVGIDFLGVPFSELTLIKIAAAYTSSTKHRKPPQDFGPLANEP